MVRKGGADLQFWVGDEMQNVGLILLVFAFVFACLATRGIGSPPWSLGWAAVAFWIASELIGGLGRVFH